MRLVARRSLAARDDLPAGVVVDESMVLALRPGTGIPPNRLRDVLGRRVARDVRAGELLDETDLE
jgi:sialic acid synthase SpsE